jgi:hypothetical protein
MRGCLPALFAPYLGGPVRIGLSSARTRLVPTPTFFVDGSPSAPFGFVLGSATIFIALLDMLGLALLLIRVFILVTLRH